METRKMTEGERKIAKLAFPQYRGRKFTADVRSTYAMENYWDGGTRCYVKAVNLTTGEVAEPHVATTWAHTKAAHAEFEIPQGVALIEHSIFCGKDCGLRYIVAPPVAIESQPVVAALATEVR